MAKIRRFAGALCRISPIALGGQWLEDMRRRPEFGAGRRPSSRRLAFATPMVVGTLGVVELPQQGADLDLCGLFDGRWQQQHGLGEQIA